jgi:DNA ligase-1
MFIEYKYDGERVQIHKDKRGGITAYSRRLENITNQYPEIIEQARKSLSAKEAIVEGEVVAIDPKTKKLQAFQVLMQHKRKHEKDIAERCRHTAQKYLYEPINLCGASTQLLWEFEITTGVAWRHGSYKPVSESGGKGLRKAIFV